ncbi:hypothetical protein WJX82_006827 [Trebouxia sp. C0006]
MPGSAPVHHPQDSVGLTDFLMTVDKGNGAGPTDHQLTASMLTGVHPSDWSSLAEQLLVHVFEQQHNALDNCAAACTCATWRRVVNSSHISLLHLHADQAPYGYLYGIEMVSDLPYSRCLEARQRLSLALS